MGLCESCEDQHHYCNKDEKYYYNKHFSNHPAEAGFYTTQSYSSYPPPPPYHVSPIYNPYTFTPQHSVILSQSQSQSSILS
jgi:hypothetical protein